MKTLLIYNENVATSLATEFEGETYLFQIGKAELLNPNFTIDAKIHSILISEIEQEKYDAIFIPFSLSEDNYIEFIGLRFAFHIRLTKEFGNIQTPIIFYGSENATEVNKLSELGSILFSKNVYTTDKIWVEQFNRQSEWIQENYKEMNEENFLKSFVSMNLIKPSGNYATHHSITNEWSIYRWAKTLKLENDSIKKIQNIIESNLYFKYLKAKYPISESFDSNDKCALQDGTVLYIDDELEKGWDIILKKIRNPKTVKFLGSDFKNLTADKIIETTIEYIKANNPDVVLLDFRLHDDDFETTNPQNVTGYKILDWIKKEYNQGIQVIILSATNKIWNLLDLQQIGADGFILKESPELSVEADFSINALNKLYSEIENALPKAKFLKSVVSKMKEIKTMLGINLEENNLTDFQKSTHVNFDIAFKLLNDSFITIDKKTNNKKYINHAYLPLFLIIENWLNQDSVFIEKDGNLYVINGEKKYLIRKPTGEDKEYEYAIQWNDNKKLYEIGQETKKQVKSFEDIMFKMSAVLFFKFGVESLEGHIWHKINGVRNHKIGHVHGNDFVEQKEINQILDFMLFIFKTSNFTETDMSEKALKEETIEEKLKALQSKYSSNNQ